MEETKVHRMGEIESYDMIREEEVDLQEIIAKLWGFVQKGVKKIIQSLQIIVEVQGLLHSEIVKNGVSLQTIIKEI